MKRVSCCIAALVLIPFLGGCTTYVRPAPPPLRAEIIGPAPYAAAVWIKGHWAWRHGGYVWVPGHWRSAY